MGTDGETLRRRLAAWRRLIDARKGIGLPLAAGGSPDSPAARLATAAERGTFMAACEGRFPDDHNKPQRAVPPPDLVDAIKQRDALAATIDAMTAEPFAAAREALVGQLAALDAIIGEWWEMHADLAPDATSKADWPAYAVAFVLAEMFRARGLDVTAGPDKSAERDKKAGAPGGQNNVPGTDFARELAAVYRDLGITHHCMRPACKARDWSNARDAGDAAGMAAADPRRFASPGAPGLIVWDAQGRA